MKKNILAIAIATAVAAPAAMADAKIYGYFNTALENVSEKGTTWDNRNSRIGIKGSEDLGNGLKAIYQFETGVDINKGEWNQAKRNTFLGLAGNFGTVLAGRHDTPLRMIQPTDHFADAKYSGTNRGLFNGGNMAATGEDRLDNVIAYLSPNFEGFQFALAGAHHKDGSAVKAKDTSPANAYSASISYGKKSDGLYLAAAGTKVTDKYRSKAQERTNYRLTAQYRTDGLTSYIMYNQIKDGAAQSFYDESGVGAGFKNDSSKVVTVGFAYDMGAFTPKLKVSHIRGKGYEAAGFVDSKGDFTGAVALGDKAKDNWTNIALGLDYKLGKNTKAFAEVTQLNKKQLHTFKGSFANGDLKEKSTTAVSIGMNHKF